MIQNWEKLLTPKTKGPSRETLINYRAGKLLIAEVLLGQVRNYYQQRKSPGILLVRSVIFTHVVDVLAEGQVV